MKYAIIGAGMSGLSIANMLINSNNKVVVFESDSRPGGMIKCDRVNGSLFHRTGGHVFNTKRKDVSDWFWKHFNRDSEFTKAARNASVALSSDKMIPYPIENYVYMLDESIMKSVIEDWICIANAEKPEPTNFEEFLRGRFGETLYSIYFKQYNYKVWRKNLTTVPLSWLDGKLPMPTVKEMFFNNIRHVEENNFVHSKFYYPINGGSQFIAERLATGLDIRLNSEISCLNYAFNKWIVNGEDFDRVIFCGNIKQLPSLINNQIDISASLKQEIFNLESHGTTTVFCEIERNNYSWIYLPSKDYESHRIICTGNFAESNNFDGVLTASIEFTDSITEEDIILNLKKMPYSPRYLTHHYCKYTYPIQSATTRKSISELKTRTEPLGLYLLGRFAEWEYYNMDVAIGAAIDLVKRIQ